MEGGVNRGVGQGRENRVARVAGFTTEDRSANERNRRSQAAFDR
jgi:hypothetical protein